MTVPESPHANEAPPVVCAGVVVADHVCAPLSRLPEAGELMMTEELRLNIGGCASNAAVDLARMQVRSAVCGCVGDDIFGRFVSETLHAHGVDTRGLRVSPEYATSQTLIVNVRGQDRRFIHEFGANRDFTAADLPLDLIRAARVFYVGGYLVVPGLTQEGLASAFRAARTAGVVTMLDVVTPGPGDYFPLLRELLPLCDVFLPNTDEARLISGETDPLRQAEIFHRAGARTVVVTLGEGGAALVGDGLRLRAGAFPVPFVDGSGGGDAFDAGYICGLLEGRDPRGCLTLASALGASCVRAIGTTAGVFERQEAEAFLAEHTLPIEVL